MEGIGEEVRNNNRQIWKAKDAVLSLSPYTQKTWGDKEGLLFSLTTISKIKLGPV